MLTNTIITNFNEEEQERIGKILLSMGCTEWNFTRYGEHLNFIKVSENGEFGNYGRYCDIESITHLTAKEFFEKYSEPVNKTTDKQVDKPKFKVGDMVKMLSKSKGDPLEFRHKIGDTGIIERWDNCQQCWVVKDDYFLDKDLELVEEKHTSLTKTIITDIKDDEQADRVCKKLESIGIKRCGILKKATNSFNILQILHNGHYIWYDSDEPLWTHITASEFLVEDKYEPPTKTTVVSEGMVKILEENLKNNNLKTFEHCVGNKKTNNMSIVNFFNDLTVSGEDKELRKAGLKDDSLQWTLDAIKIVSDLEAKELGFKTFNEMAVKNCSDTCLTPLEANTLFTKFYPKLLETAKKYNRKDEVKKAK